MFFHMFTRCCYLHWIRADFALLIPLHCLWLRQLFDFLTLRKCVLNICVRRRKWGVNKAYGGIWVHTTAWRMHMNSYGCIWMHTNIININIYIYTYIYIYIIQKRIQFLRVYPLKVEKKTKSKIKHIEDYVTNRLKTKGIYTLSSLCGWRP